MTDFEFDVREIPLTPPIGVLIDAGVNRGQFAQVALPHFMPEIFCGFEPLWDLASDADNLVRQIAEDEQITWAWDWYVAPVALGDQCEVKTISRVSHDPSSSLLSMGPGSEAYGIPMSVAGAESVQVLTLDAICNFDWKLRESRGMFAAGDGSGKVLAQFEKPIDLLKIDVQGYEGRVLRGAREMLKRTKFVVVEILFCQHYIGQSSPEEIDQLLREGGLKFIKWLRRHPNAENPLEGDALYGRAEA